MMMDLSKGPKPFLHRFANHILCWEPVYLENRVNGCHVVFQDKPELFLNKSAKHVTCEFAKDRGVEMKQMRRKYEYAVGKTQNLPILLMDVGAVFSPVRCRKNPDNRNDGVTGYVNLRHINQVLSGPKDTAYIELSNGYKMRVYMSSALVRERIRESHGFHDLYAFWYGVTPRD
jgi:hypothetical protein